MILVVTIHFVNEGLGSPSHWSTAGNSLLGISFASYKIPAVYSRLLPFYRRKQKTKLTLRKKESCGLAFASMGHGSLTGVANPGWRWASSVKAVSHAIPQVPWDSDFTGLDGARHFFPRTLVSSQSSRTTVLDESYIPAQVNPLPSHDRKAQRVSQRRESDTVEMRLPLERHHSSSGPWTFPVFLFYYSTILIVLMHISEYQCRTNGALRRGLEG